MLCITRRDGEEIVVRIPGRTEPLIIKCCGVKGERARIGVLADKDITVDRREIDNEKQAAVAAQFGA